jgi:streptogramin lyase
MRIGTICVLLGVLANPAAAVTLSPGDVVAAVGDAVVRVDPATGEKTTLASGFAFEGHMPAGLAVNVDGTVLVGEYGADALTRLDPETGARTVVSSGGSLLGPTGVAVEADGRILVTTAPGPEPNQPPGELVRVDPLSGAQTVIATGFALPSAVVVEADGSVLLVDVFGSGLLLGDIIRVDPTTGEQTLVASNVGAGFGLGGAIAALPDVDGTLLAVHMGFIGGNPGVTRLDPTTGQGQLVAELSGQGGYLGAALDANRFVLIADMFSDDLIRVDPATGEAESLASGYFGGVAAFTTACCDGFDNDSDGVIDYPWDPGCTNPRAASEVGSGGERPAGIPVSGRTLTVSDDPADADRRQLRVSSRDGSIPIPSARTVADPSRNGAVLQVGNPATGEWASIDLPASGWSIVGKSDSPKGYKYRDRDLANGPCRIVLVKQGKLKLKCQGGGIGLTLDEPEGQGLLVVSLQFGGMAPLCMEFGGRVVRDQAADGGELGLFKAKGASAPGACAQP